MKRERMNGFKKICQIFSEEKVRKCIAEADNIFLSFGKKKAAGDPDLFVHMKDLKDCFFVEVKENDQVTPNQKISFPIIEKHLCPVFIARVFSQ
ncbi:VRR-NUC domain-containing protein [Thermodesulfobacteriota bacterium]